MATKPNTLFLYQYSQMHQTATARADGRGDGVTARIVGGTIRGSDWWVGKDCGGGHTWLVCGIPAGDR